jgi:methyl-accepting chemotaxis protein
MSKPSDRRSIRNIRLTARFHSRYLSVWLVSAIVPIVALNVAIYFLFRALWQTSYAGEDASLHVVTPSAIVGIIVVETVLLCLNLIGLAAITVHRISGPYINLKRSFGRVRGGDIGYRMKFRKDDRLDDIADEFNGMMDELRKRIGEGRPAPTGELRPV